MFSLPNATHVGRNPCFALTTYMLTCLHAYMLTCLHAYMLTCIHAYMLTCLERQEAAERRSRHLKVPAGPGHYDFANLTINQFNCSISADWTGLQEALGRRPEEASESRRNPSRPQKTAGGPRQPQEAPGELQEEPGSCRRS